MWRLRDWKLFLSSATVDGRNPVNSPVEVGSSLSHCLQIFLHPRWCRISAIDSRTLEFQKT